MKIEQYKLSLLQQIKWIYKWQLETYTGAFNNRVEKRGWVGGLKFAIFVHFQYIKSVHKGRWVVNKEQNHVHMVFEWPLAFTDSQSIFGFSSETENI